MGDLLLCSGSPAGVPYYIEGVSINIYSPEELCYFILHNTFLIEKSFMNKELCAWFEREFQNDKLAEKLRTLMDEDGNLIDFVKEILNDCGYCTLQETRDILLTLADLEEKTDFERNKIRADRLMEKEKFLSSIYEYKRLLDSDEITEVEDWLIGDIWHNLGIAYARMFLFEEAVKCFGRAYEKNHKEESLKSQMFTYLCMNDEEDFLKVAQDKQLDEMAIQSVRNEWALRGQTPQEEEFRSKIEKVMSGDSQEYRSYYKQQISDMIFDWKEDYRRISSV